MRVNTITIILIYLGHVKCNSDDLTKDRTTTNYDITSTSRRIRDQTYPAAVFNDVPKSIVTVYAGTLAELYCSSEIADKVTWMFAKSLESLIYTPVLERDRVVIQNRSLAIYRATTDDEGVYRCQTDKRLHGLIVLEVINDDCYTVMKNDIQSSANFKQSIGKELMIYNVWSDWSECSTCGKEGRRRRFGMCYIKPGTFSQSEKNINVSRRFTIFEAFPKGIPCRSRHLPDNIRNLPSVRNKRNVIMITPCKIQCNVEIFEVRSPTNVLLETANNTAGIYSLLQPLPAQPPAPARSILFVGRGQRVLVTCPGTTLKDMPVTWRAGTKTVEPRVVEESSGGRVHVNARDHIIIAHVLHEDGHLYSCWEGDNLAGTVKLVVWAGGQARWNHHTVLLVLAILGLVLLHVSVRML